MIFSETKSTVPRMPSLYQTADDSPGVSSPRGDCTLDEQNVHFRKPWGFGLILAGHPVPGRELYGDGQHMAGRKGTGRKIPGPIRLLLLQPRECSRKEALCNLESSI